MIQLGQSLSQKEPLQPRVLNMSGLWLVSPDVRPSLASQIASAAARFSGVWRHLLRMLGAEAVSGFTTLDKRLDLLTTLIIFNY